MANNSTNDFPPDQPITLEFRIHQVQSTEVQQVTILLQNSAGQTESDPIMLGKYNTFLQHL